MLQQPCPFLRCGVPLSLLLTRTVFPGGSGFIAGHVLRQLFADKTPYRVVATVRSPEKAAPIHAAYPDLGPDRLQTVLVPEVARADAFDAVLQQHPDVEVVFHMAAPFHYRVADPTRELVDPAVLGTRALLRAVAAYAPRARRVVLTSSFNTMFDLKRSADPTAVFTEATWNSITVADIGGSPQLGYMAAKTLAERAAWDFVRSEHTPPLSFDLVTINPPYALGPVVHHLAAAAGLDSINTSNARIADAITGMWKQQGAVPDTPNAQTWIDVRDLARVHILAGLEKPDAGGRRLMPATGFVTNRAVYEIIRKNFPELADKLPSPDAPGGYEPPKHYQYDNTETKKYLGIEWTPLEKTVVDTVNSLKAHMN
ncbi:NAD dependent epimerase [Niveomyces insectorum RCEF 264]|uniref:NAD dependent epimerase n=1 Tax=Niveomyces insectorum RCEF 264 TaxID=1081102 RepID=A0A167NQN8_9HYPO|nr:NAD dependent epimerase [Niveomyces insectorum RCEF 264]